MKGGGSGGTHGGYKNHQRYSLGKPWSKYHRNIGAYDGGILTCSRGQRETVGGASVDSEILGWIRSTPRWVDDPVQMLEIMGQKQVRPSWEENPVRGKCRG